MLKRALNKRISSIKKEDYVIDPRVPSGYLIGLALRKAMMKMRGFLIFPGTSGRPFVGSHVTIRCRSKITLGSAVTIDDHCYIDALSTDGIRLGSNVSIGKSTKIECTGILRYLGKGLAVGDHVGLGSDNFFGCAGGIEIGDYTIIGNFVSFHAENHNYSRDDLPIKLQGVTHLGIRVGRNCWIGAKATILDGAVLEEGCIIAAAALVTEGVYKKNGIYGGVPAKLLKYRFDG